MFNLKIVDVKTTSLSCEMKGYSDNRYFAAEPFGGGRRYLSQRPLTITQLVTDDGIIGIGTHAHCVPPPLFEATVETLKNFVIGEDPFYVERIWDKMFRLTFRFGRRGAVIGAMSSIDIALWDIVGKALNTPLYKLLGAYCDMVPVYASGGYFREHNDVKNLAREVTDWVERGYTAVKFKIGALGIEQDVERVKAVREALGPDIKIIVDANGGYPNPFTAMKVARALERYDVYWFEEPLQTDDIEGLAEIRRAVNIPIASGEIQFTRYGFKELIVKRAVDIVEPDAGICGGVTEFRRIAAMAAAYDLPVAPHRSTEVSMHLAASIPNSLIVESFPLETEMWDKLFLEPIEVKNGYIKLPRKPGLGIELNEKAIAKYEIP